MPEHGKNHAAMDNAMRQARITSVSSAYKRHEAPVCVFFTVADHVAGHVYHTPFAQLMS